MKFLRLRQEEDRVHVAGHRLIGDVEALLAPRSEPPMADVFSGTPQRDAKLGSAHCSGAPREMQVGEVEEALPVIGGDAMPAGAGCDSPIVPVIGAPTGGCSSAAIRAAPSSS